VDTAADYEYAANLLGKSGDPHSSIPDLIERATA
jgi:hypothetical protein